MDKEELGVALRLAAATDRLEQRILRLERLLCAISDNLPTFIRASLPDLVKNTLKTIREEITKG